MPPLTPCPAAIRRAALPLVLLGAALTSGACSTAAGSSPDAAPEAPAIEVGAVAPVTRDLSRTLRVTGTLIADEQAEVSAETPGRVVATPVERGTRVEAGAVLIQLATEQAAAQLAEAEANAGQIAAGLGLGTDGTLDPERVPEVANARAEWRLAEAQYDRFRLLREQNVVSASEYDQRKTKVEATRQRYETERNVARQRYQAYEAAKARVRLARKALADTTVRAPFAGIVGERLVSVGDFVTTGHRVATVVRNTPLRVALTVPEQAVALVKAGQTVGLSVDAHPGRRFAGTVRYVSPALRADQRSLVVEATVPNADGALMPGLFATADIEQAVVETALMIDARHVRDVGATRRVFVIAGDRAEERIIRTGQPLGELVEVVAGLSADDRLADARGAALTDGARVRVAGGPAAAPRSVD